MLVVGILRELRASAPRRLRVKVGGPGHGVARVPGARVVSEDPQATLVALEPGVDAQEVLRAALAAGPVQHFGREPPGLTDLYRELVPR